jgi:hypothetical protein
MPVGAGRGGEAGDLGPAARGAVEGLAIGARWRGERWGRYVYFSQICAFLSP